MHRRDKTASSRGVASKARIRATTGGRERHAPPQANHPRTCIPRYHQTLDGQTDTVLLGECVKTCKCGSAELRAAGSGCALGLYLYLSGNNLAHPFASEVRLATEGSIRPAAGM